MLNHPSRFSQRTKAITGAASAIIWSYPSSNYLIRYILEKMVGNVTEVALIDTKHGYVAPSDCCQVISSKMDWAFLKQVRPNRTAVNWVVQCCKYIARRQENYCKTGSTEVQLQFFLCSGLNPFDIGDEQLSTSTRWGETVSNLHIARTM